MNSNWSLYQNPLWSRIQEIAKHHPEKICVSETSGHSLTYGELTKRVDLVAEDLLSKGFSKGDRALFLARSSIDSIVYLLAILRAGGVIVAADPAMGRESFKSRVKLAEPKWVILEPLLYFLQVLPGLESLLRTFGIAIPDTGRKGSMQKIKVRGGTVSTKATAFAEIQVASSEDALIVYTSGTTSLPKGVVHTYDSILATLDLIQTDLHPETTDIFYASQSYFLLMAFLSGATAILPKETKFEPSVFMNHVHRFRVSKVFLLPAEAEELITYCTDTNQKLPSSMQTVMLGSAPVLKGFLMRLQSILLESTDILCIYGSTEIIPIARISLSEKLAFTGEGDILGTPFSSVQVRIQNDEIVATGPNLASRYLEGESLHEYVTGDLGTIDESGRLILLGRQKDMIIKGNYNIYPTMFESVISSIPGVRQCAMIGRYRDTKSDEDIILVIEPDEYQNEDAFRKLLIKELASGPHSIDSYAQPDQIVFMPIPLGGRSRKIDKALLREQVQL